MAARNPEVSLTAWLDPVLDYFAQQAGIPTDQYSAQVGGEGIAVALETICDLFTKGWLNKGVQAISGLIACAYAIWGRDVPTRLRRELLALGTHELLRFVDPKPSDVIEFQQSIAQFLEGVKEGDIDKAMSAILRTPDEIYTLSRALGIPVGQQAPTPAPETYSPEVYVPPPTPAPAPEEYEKEKEEKLEIY